jgi:hypothetical protein
LHFILYKHYLNSGPDFSGESSMHLDSAKEKVTSLGEDIDNVNNTDDFDYPNIRNTEKFQTTINEYNRFIEIFNNL